MLFPSFIGELQLSNITIIINSINMVAELMLGEPIIIILLLTDVIVNKLINFVIIQLNIITILYIIIDR